MVITINGIKIDTDEVTYITTRNSYQLGKKVYIIVLHLTDYDYCYLFRFKYKIVRLFYYYRIRISKILSNFVK